MNVLLSPNEESACPGYYDASPASYPAAAVALVIAADAAYDECGNLHTVLGAGFEPWCSGAVVVPNEANEIAYENALRTIGLQLETLGARSFSLVETLEGYTVLWIVAYGPAPIVREFRHEELAAIEEGWRRQRAGDGPRPDVTAQTEAGGELKYQNFLRGLGFELDRQGARMIAIDELEDRVLLTYQYQDPRYGLEWRKAYSVMSDRDRRQIEERALLRRKVEEKRRWWLP